MFTGIVEAVGELAFKENAEGGMRLGIKTPASFKLAERVQIGDSIATNGTCLTAVTIEGDVYFADASFETLNLTAFNSYKLGHRLNLELACTPATHLGGHIVQGHVDGVGEIVKIERRGQAFNILIKAPRELLPYIAKKGSIAVDGASLTVNDVLEEGFRLTVIPHTVQVLAFDNWQAGALVNLEVDVMARYVERLMSFGRGQSESAGVTMETLLKNGFL